MALKRHCRGELPLYAKALALACDASPPPFGRKYYGELYRQSATDPDWVALSLLTAAQSEGEGARHLWDMAACTADARISKPLQQHAIDEARHSRGYVTLLGLVFPEAADEELRAQLRDLAPAHVGEGVPVASAGSPYAYAATLDELIQMNVAEIRTRMYHQLQRPVLLDRYCSARHRPKVEQLLDWLLIDETQHVAYTAELIERIAQDDNFDEVVNLMREQVRDFNEITEEEVAQRTLFDA